MKSKFLSFVLGAVLCLFAIVPASAEESGSADAGEACTVVQAYAEENTLDVIARGGFDLQRADVKVANKQAAITGSGSVADGAVRVRTTVLVDVSTSIPAKTRGKVLEFIEAEIRDLADYEELRLVTFGDKVDVIRDFSSDRYDLSNTAKEIKFTATASAVYDAINSTITHPGTQNGAACYNRTIVITDGADYAAGGITKEELFIRLGAERYPIDVVGVSAEKLQNPNKDLAALARISNGNYVELYPKTDVSACAAGLSVGELFWLRAEVPVNLLDGSTRQVDLSDGVNSISFDMKMSVVDAPEPVESDDFSISFPEGWGEPVSSTENTPESVPDEDDGVNAVIFIAVGGGVLTAGAVVTALLIIMRKKKKAEKQVHEQPAPDIPPEKSRGETEVLSDNEGVYTVTLSLCGEPGQSRTIVITDSITAGRADNCELKFNDSSVSREQFKLVASDRGVVLTNLSASNITKVNNNAVKADVLLKPGDIIKLGRVSLSVDLIQKVTDDNPQSGNENRSGDTMTVF